LNTARLTLPPALSNARMQLRARWQALSLRDRRLVTLAAVVIGLFLVWTVAVQPAWRTVREAPTKLDQLDTQLQQMQRLAAESRELRNASPLSTEQSGDALKASTERLGERARLSLQGERAVLTLSGVSGEQLRTWLTEARSGARARPVEAQLSRGSQGYSGTVIVAIGGSAP
jgi:general secretion pathway protein M